MFGHHSGGRVKIFPGATYCQPQIASTGLTEKQAKEKKLDYKVGKFPFTASGKAVAKLSQFVALTQKMKPAA